MRGVWLAIVLILVSSRVVANQCEAIFTGPVSSSVGAGELRIERNAILGGTNGTVDFDRIRDNSRGSSCVTRACQLSGVLAKRPYLPVFDSSPSSFDITFQRNSRVSLVAGDYDDVRLERDSILTFNSEDQIYRFDTLRIRRNSTVNFSSGTYYIRDFNIERDVNIVVESGNSVVIYVNRLTSQRNVRLNGNGSAGQLMIVAYDRISLERDMLVNGFLHADNSIRFKQNIRVTGAANAEDIRVDRNAFINYDISSIDQLYDRTICGDAPAETGSQVAYYEFDDTSWDNSGDVSDTLNNYNGNALFGNQPFASESPVSCTVLAVGDNTNNDTHGVDSRLDMNVLGSSGTISFWYKNNENWVGNGAKQLLDASSASSLKYFYLSITSQGRFSFGMEDETDGDFHYLSDVNSIAADVWTHITLAWNIGNRDVDIYVNGQLLGGSTAVNTLRSSVMGELETLVIGDNRSSYRVYNGTNDAANGEFDNVKVYDYRRSADEVLTEYNNEEAIEPTCVELSHYDVIHPSQSLTCDSAEVTIRACANASCDELVSNEVTVNLSNGDWSPSQSISFTGSTQVSLSQLTEGEHTITVTGANSASMAANATECTNNCTIDFVNAGFQFFDASLPYNSALPAFVAGDNLARVGLRAVQNNNGQCQALLSGERAVSLGFDCVTSVGTEYASDVCRVPFGSINVSGDGSGVSSGSVNLTFDANGETTLSGLTYEDASRLNLSASATVDGVTISSGNVVLDSIPFGLEVSAATQNQNTAGADFELSISAISSSGTVLPSYSPGNLRARFVRVLPDASVSGAAEAQLSLSSVVALTSQTGSTYQNVSLDNWSNGSYRYQASVSDVGTYTLEFEDSGYLGNQIAALSAQSLGAFIPAYFDVSAAVTPSFADQCTNFTYIGQPFDYAFGQEPTLNVIAYNAQGVITQNYRGDLVRLVPDTRQLEYNVNNSYAGTLSVEQNGVVNISDAVSAGGVEVSIRSSQVQFEKIASPANAFDADIDLTLPLTFLTDTDGVCYQSNYPTSGCEAFTFSNIGGTELRYGRVRLENAYGPEDSPLRVPLYADYFNGDAWVINSDDSCSGIDLSQTSGQITIANLSQGNQETDITGLVNSATSAGILSAGQSGNDDFLFTPAIVNDVAQRGTFSLSLEPGVNNPYWDEFLNIDWNLDGVIDSNDKPTASVSFGHFRGNDRTLNWREQFD